MSETQTNESSIWRDYYLVIQGFFYLAQGVTMGALVFITAYLDYLGVPPFERILFQAIIAIPWYLKIIFGVLSDNVKIKEWGRENGAVRIVIESKRDAIPFWKRMGFQIYDQGSELSTGYFKLKEKDS